ncbi:hypothetical protein HYS97_01035 [Candidatus Daviesbacteria bacterium]|nr:hypothetical protein [Candidatus Daviesbacteria bacterium]
MDYCPERREKMPIEKIGEIARAAVLDLKRFSGGQIAPEVYLDQRPLGLSKGEVTELTAVWQGAKRLAGIGARRVVFGENPQIVGRRGQLRLEIISGLPDRPTQEVFVIQNGTVGRPRTFKETLQRGYGLEGLTGVEEARFTTVLGNIQNITAEARVRGLLVNNAEVKA